MELKSGFKQTDVGVIPEDWDFTRLGTIANFRTGPFGSSLHKSDYVYGGVPVINPMQIIDGKIVNTPRMAISETAAQNLSEFRLLEGDIVIGRRGEMGRCAVVQCDQSGWLCGTGSMIVRPKASLEARFAQRVLSSSPVVAAIEATSVGTTMINLNQSTLSNLKVPIPPTYAEQQAIAEALSDMDALIEFTEQLLNKKRKINQGSMQGLLTGQRRLPGFNAEWETRTLGSICHIKTGARNNQDKLDDGDYPFFVRSATVEKINSYSYDCEAILVPGEGGIGSIFHYINGKFDVHQRVYAITQFSPEVSGMYVYLCMSEKFGAHAMQNSVKATVDSLRLPTFLEFEIQLPPTLDEQVAIATVLSAMDNEITTLETKLQKARHLKQGMMQELLTGRIRLV
ncbi:restriction endonuclease subunit S [Pseudomonas sp. RL_105y_Pfl1_103]|uniref:restriction endonuclease subunit S n=1 Tax=Pseudomonas sp. RL_105y_Pfl1_103 TaxID=3088707 RepID=UPI0030D9D02B